MQGVLALCVLAVHIAAASAGPGGNPFDPAATVQVVHLPKASVKQSVSIPLDTCNSEDDSAKWQVLYSTGEASDCEIVGVSGCVITVSCMAPAYDPKFGQVSFSVESRSSMDIFPGELVYDEEEPDAEQRRSMLSVPTPIYDAAKADGAVWFSMTNFITGTPFNSGNGPYPESATDANDALRSAITQGFGSCFYGHCDDAVGWYISPQDALQGKYGSSYGFPMTYGMYGMYGMYGFYGVGPATSTLVYLDENGGIDQTFGTFPSPYSPAGPADPQDYHGRAFGTGMLVGCSIQDGSRTNTSSSAATYATTGDDGRFSVTVDPPSVQPKSYTLLQGLPFNTGCADAASGLTPAFDLESMYVGAVGTSSYVTSVNTLTTFMKLLHDEMAPMGYVDVVGASSQTAAWLDVSGLAQDVNLFAYDFLTMYNFATTPEAAAAAGQLLSANAMMTTAATSFGNLILAIVDNVGDLETEAKQAIANSASRDLLSALAQIAMAYSPESVGSDEIRRSLLSTAGTADLTSSGSMSAYYGSAAPSPAPAGFSDKADAVATATSNLNGLIAVAVLAGGSIDDVLTEISKAMIFANGGLADLVQQLGDGSLSLTDFGSQTSADAMNSALAAIVVPGQGPPPVVPPPPPSGFAPINPLFSLFPNEDDNDWEWGSTNATILFVVGMLVFVGLIGGAVFVMNGKSKGVAQKSVVSV